jgi:hypothetical protein
MLKVEVDVDCLVSLYMRRLFLLFIEFEYDDMITYVYELFRFYCSIGPMD